MGLENGDWRVEWQSRTKLVKKRSFGCGSDSSNLHYATVALPIVMTTNYTVNYSSNFLVAVLSDRIQAEEALLALGRENIPSETRAILGRGFQSIDEFGLVDPIEQTWKRLQFTAVWLVPFGLVAGMGFNLITGLNTFPWAGDVGNVAIGGVLGMVGAAMGSVLASDAIFAVLGGKKSRSYRQRIESGEFLVVVKGGETLVRRATKVLLKYETLSLESYPV